LTLLGAVISAFIGGIAQCENVVKSAREKQQGFSVHTQNGANMKIRKKLIMGYLIIALLVTAVGLFSV